MRQRIARELRRELFTARLAPATQEFLKMVPGSNGRKIDYLVQIVRPLFGSTPLTDFLSTGSIIRQINENVALATAATQR